MKFKFEIPVFGDIDYRGQCPPEAIEQVTFFNVLRRDYPELAMVATHIRNEGKRHSMQTMKQKAEGMVKGASDVIIPASMAFVCEIKRQDHTQSRWQEGQENYLLTAQKLGAFACVALGHKGALEALEAWNTTRTMKNG